MKRPLNAFFKLMLDAKKRGLTSFKYNSNTYKGKKHEKLGVIFKRGLTSFKYNGNTYKGKKHEKL